jgi:hypothetical protein
MYVFVDQQRVLFDQLTDATCAQILNKLVSLQHACCAPCGEQLHSAVPSFTPVHGSSVSWQNAAKHADLGDVWQPPS